MAALLSWLPSFVFDPLQAQLISHLGTWRMVIMPLALILVMLYWPRGIMGLREFRGFIPRADKKAHSHNVHDRDDPYDNSDCR
jgi:branched-chain amino acid transport system permease protein